MSELAYYNRNDLVVKTLCEWAKTSSYRETPLSAAESIKVLSDTLRVSEPYRLDYKDYNSELTIFDLWLKAVRIRCAGHSNESLGRVIVKEKEYLFATFGKCAVSPDVEKEFSAIYNQHDDKKSWIEICLDLGLFDENKIIMQKLLWDAVAADLVDVVENMVNECNVDLNFEYKTNDFKTDSYFLDFRGDTGFRRLGWAVKTKNMAMALAKAGYDWALPDSTGLPNFESYQIYKDAKAIGLEERKEIVSFFSQILSDKDLSPQEKLWKEVSRSARAEDVLIACNKVNFQDFQDEDGNNILHLISSVVPSTLRPLSQSKAGKKLLLKQNAFGFYPFEVILATPKDLRQRSEMGWGKLFDESGHPLLSKNHICALRVLNRSASVGHITYDRYSNAGGLKLSDNHFFKDENIDGFVPWLCSPERDHLCAKLATNMLLPARLGGKNNKVHGFDLKDAFDLEKINNNDNAATEKIMFKVMSDWLNLARTKDHFVLLIAELIKRQDSGHKEILEVAVKRAVSMDIDILKLKENVDAGTYWSGVSPMWKDLNSLVEHHKLSKVADSEIKAAPKKSRAL